MLYIIPYNKMKSTSASFQRLIRAPTNTSPSKQTFTFSKGERFRKQLPEYKDLYKDAQQIHIMEKCFKAIREELESDLVLALILQEVLILLHQPLSIKSKVFGRKIRISRKAQVSAWEERLFIFNLGCDLQQLYSKRSVNESFSIKL